MPTQAIKPPNIKRISLKDWLKGTVTAFDDGRTPTDGLRGSGNLMLDQDGTLRPRPSLVRYGTQFPGTLLGQLFEFVKASGSTNQNYMLGMFVVGGVGKIYYSKDGGAWTNATGKTYSATAAAHYIQIDNKVLVMNGSDNLSYMDIVTLTITPYNALATPTAPTLAATNLTGTAFTYYYRVTANSTVGETAASTSASIQVGTQRDLWIPLTGTGPQYVTLTWTAVPSAVSYNVYLGTVQGQETLIAAGVAGTSYKDDGTAVADVTRAAPAGDTTAGPKVSRGQVINGQVFIWGDADNTRYVRFGGAGQWVLDFTPFNGGGYVEIGRGTKEVPVSVKSFRDGRGNSQITVLCQGTNGTGKRYLLTPSTTTYGSIVISYMKVTEDNGQDGTDSPDGVILYEDSLWYPSRDGFKTTGTKPQLQNILSTSYITETIANDVKNLNNAAMATAVGIGWQRRLYWALPNGSTTNNEIWVLDLQRGGAWVKPWSISAQWLMLYNDNSGTTHFIVVGTNNVLYELSDSQATYDDSVPFATQAASGLIKFSDDGLDWAKVIDVTFMLLRPQGVINFTIAGKTEDVSSLSTVGTNSFQSNASVAGWGEASWGGSPDEVAPNKTMIFGWSDFSVVPVSFGDVLKQITIEIDEELQWLTWNLNTTQGAVFYQLSDVIVRYVDIGVKDLS